MKKEKILCTAPRMKIRAGVMPTRQERDKTAYRRRPKHRLTTSEVN